jgi:predicted dienelactone hydrolase
MTVIGHTRFLAVALVACSGTQSTPRTDVIEHADVVGVQTISFRASSGTVFEARVWYPSGGTSQTLSANAVTPGYRAVPDGAIALGGRAPLVILIHGSGGGADGVAWIGVELARHGAIAVAANHPASSYAGAPTNRRLLDIWEQPDDVRAMLDQLAATPWAARIAPERIAVVGYSLGGTSALLLAGARLDFAKVPTFCRTHEDLACTTFAPDFASFDAAFLEHANADHTDHRIKAAVAIAPGFTEAMTAESLKILAAPTLLIAAAHDQVLPPKTHVRPMLGNLRPPSGYHEIASAQHFSFLFVCNPGAVKLLADSHEEYLCQDQAGASRAQIHAEALDAIVRFLRARNVL